METELPGKHCMSLWIRNVFLYPSCLLSACLSFTLGLLVSSCLLRLQRAGCCQSESLALFTEKCCSNRKGRKNISENIYSLKRVIEGVFFFWVEKRKSDVLKLEGNDEWHSADNDNEEQQDQRRKERASQTMGEEWSDWFCFFFYICVTVLPHLSGLCDWTVQDKRSGWCMDMCGFKKNNETRRTNKMFWGDGEEAQRGEMELRHAEGSTCPDKALNHMSVAARCVWLQPALSPRELVREERIMEKAGWREDRWLLGNRVGGVGRNLTWLKAEMKAFSSRLGRKLLVIQLVVTV